MNIGRASRESGVSMKAIRKYEEVGLVGSIRRLDNSYRDYSEDDVRRLKFIRRARSLGFSLKQIGTLLQLRDNQNRACREVLSMAQDHLRELDGKVVLLREMADTLKTLADACDGSDKPDCIILQRLDDGLGIDKAA
jgi:MerR family gold-responsive transcriptional activator of gol and ges genes